MKIKLVCIYVIFICIRGLTTVLSAEDILPELEEIDSLFDTPSEDTNTAPVPDAKLPSAGVLSSMQRTGVMLDAGFTFSAGYSPGWTESPEYWGEYGRELSNAANLIMTSSLGLDFQISKEFRVYSAFVFSYPKFALAVDVFYFDYTIFDKVFLRAGKYSASAWGLSPNYPFTNLLVRTPSDIDRGEHYIGSSGNLYTAKVDVPIGVGGAQAVALVHDDFFDPDNYQSELIGFGGKYNIALRWMDIDAGFFYQKIMPFRAFASVKTTIQDTELYSEALVTFPYGTRDNALFSGNIGAIQFLFDDKLRLNGEFFYNAEKGATWLKEANPSRAQLEENSPFIEGVNIAFNLDYKTGLWAGLRFLAQFRYAVSDNSIQLVPAVRITPFPKVTVSAAFPMALGSRNGSYYRNNADSINRPFAIVLAVSISGSYKQRWN